MPSPFEQYQSQVNEFNQKFGLNFSFEEYETQQLRLNYLATNFSSNKKDSLSPENALYRGTLLNLYRESVENAIHKKSELVNQSELVRSFNKLMENYREYCKEKKGTQPKRRLEKRL